MHRSRVASALAVALIALVVTGCGDSRHPRALVGTWKLDTTRASGGERRSIPPELQRALDQVSLTLTFAPDGKLTMAANVMGQSRQQEGVWEVKDGKLLMNQSAGANAPAATPVAYRLEDGGKTLWIEGNAAAPTGSGGVYFTKQ